MRILYCEDDVDMSIFVQTMLHSLGHHVDHALTAEQGVAYFDGSLRGTPYDLILTDVEMPGHGGFYVAAQAREKGYQGRIVVLTNYEKEMVEGGMERLNLEYWPKMDTVENLATKLEAPDA